MRELSTSQISSSISCLINRYRHSWGLSRLSSNSRLVKAARIHDAEMQKYHEYQHDSHNGESFVKRIRRTGYLKKARRWALGEILDETTGSTSNATPSDAMDAWLVSKAHSDILHIAKFREFGVASVHGTSKQADAQGALITVDFGFRKR